MARMVPHVDPLPDGPNSFWVEAFAGDVEAFAGDVEAFAGDVFFHRF